MPGRVDGAGLGAGWEVVAAGAAKKQWKSRISADKDV